MTFESVRHLFLMFYFCMPLTWIDASAFSQDPEESIPYPVIISEIMADPFPLVSLPGKEYIEIFNRSTGMLDLTKWQLIIGDHEKTLPPACIMPGEYLILCDADEAGSLAQYGKTLLIQSMPPLLNTGQEITLKSPSGEVIHSVTFSPGWYGGDKDQGGWSLEIIDPHNPCGRKDNWSASLDQQGGTPGRQNSVFAPNPDHQPPVFLRATLPSDSTILLHFSEPMNALTLNSCLNYTVNKGFLHPFAAFPVEPSFSNLLLTYAHPFKYGQRYTVTLLDVPEDCAGNQISTHAFADFALAEPPDYAEVVFNEILFDPAENESEFIELINRSEKIVDLSAFCLALADPVTDTIKKLVSLEDYPFILFPDSYVLLTKNAENIPHTSLGTDLRVVIEHPGLFVLSNEEALIVLLDSNLHVIDKLHYDRFMHAPILSDTKGVSLERTEPGRPTDDRENWHSASSTKGHSTPGYENSQMIHIDETISLTVNPEVFSPDNDGLDDLATLHLQFNEPGWTGSIAIYNTRGQCVKTLLDHGLLGTDESFCWDGKWTDDKPANIGVYIFYVEIFNQHGLYKNFKKVIPLVRKYKL